MIRLNVIEVKILIGNSNYHHLKVALVLMLVGNVESISVGSDDGFDAPANDAGGFNVFERFIVASKQRFVVVPRVFKAVSCCISESFSSTES